MKQSIRALIDYKLGDPMSEPPPIVKNTKYHQIWLAVEEHPDQWIPVTFSKASQSWGIKARANERGYRTQTDMATMTIYITKKKAPK